MDRSQLKGHQIESYVKHGGGSFEEWACMAAELLVMSLLATAGLLGIKKNSSTIKLNDGLTKGRKHLIMFRFVPPVKVTYWTCHHCIAGNVRQCIEY